MRPRDNYLTMCSFALWAAYGHFILYLTGRIVRRADLSHLESLQQAAVHIGLSQQPLIPLCALVPTQKQNQHKCCQVRSGRPRHPAQCTRIES